jgi:hypothetical protein
VSCRNSKKVESGAMRSRWGLEVCSGFLEWNEGEGGRGRGRERSLERTMEKRALEGNKILILRLEFPFNFP